MTATALGVVITFELFRVWLPSVIFIYGDAGSTPATKMGLFGLAPFLFVALAAWPLATRVGPSRLAGAAGSALAISRLLLQATDGGTAQLVIATIGVTSGALWLSALARAPTATSVGLVYGFAADAILHASLRSIDLAWRTGFTTWVVVLSLVAAFRISNGQARYVDDGRTVAAWPWLVLGPVIALHLMLSGVVSRVQAISGWPESRVVAVVTIGHVLALIVAARAVADRARIVGVAGAALTFLGVTGALASGRIAVGTGTVALAVGLGLVLVHALRTGGHGTSAQRIGVTSVGLLGVFLIVFPYYAAYDMAIPVSGRTLLMVAALAVVAVAVIASPGRLAASLVGRPPRGRLALAAVIAIWIVAADSPTLGTGTTTDPDVRVVTYNIHMGFDTRGRIDIEGLARVVVDQQPDIVALNEVSRGWLVNGAADVLPQIAEAVGLPYVFAPAADEVWGNAILSRYPIVERSVTFLPGEGTPMRRSALSVVIDRGDGAEVGVIATHLHHIDADGAVRLVQAREVARLASALAASGRPVIVMGDLNAEPGDPELAPLDSVFQSVVDIRGTPPTFPSDAATVHIDHIYVSDDVDIGPASVPESLASDHLAVAATLTLP